MYSEIDNVPTIGAADSTLKSTLRSVLQLDPYQRVINDIPGKLKVYFRHGSNKTEKFWWAQRLWPNGSSHHLFGHGKPGVTDRLTSEIEFNVPLEKFSRSLGGVFLHHEVDGIVLAHRGIVSRRTRGRVPKQLFLATMTANGSQLITANSRAGTLELLLVAPMHSPILVQQLEVFAVRTRTTKA